ncbi:MAG: VOC family protein [Mycobacterium sp.]
MSNYPAPVDDVLDRATASLTVHVSDLDTSVRWYARVFGCEPLHRDTDTSLSGSSTEYAVFHLAGLKVFLSATRTDDEHQCQDEHHPPTLVFMTRHRLAQLRRELEERGALFRDDEVVDGFPVDAEGVRAGRKAEFLWFYDPDGNKMEFCRTLSRTGGAPDVGGRPLIAEAHRTHVSPIR